MFSKKYLIIDKINNLKNKCLIGEDTHNSFLEHFLGEQTKSSYWYKEPSESYKDLYVVLIPFYKKDISNIRKENLRQLNSYYKKEFDHSFIICYMKFYKTLHSYFIECIETNDFYCYRGIASTLIDSFIKKYKVNERNKFLVPIFITLSACPFWSKVFQKHYGVYNHFDLKKLEKKIHYHKKYRPSWKHLYEFYVKDLNLFIENHIKKC